MAQPLIGSEIAVIDGVTAGTVSASKAIVVDSNKDYYDSKTTTKPTGLSSMKLFNKLVLSQLNEVVTTIQVDIDDLVGPNTLQSSYYDGSTQNYNYYSVFNNNMSGFFKTISISSKSGNDYTINGYNNDLSIIDDTYNGKKLIYDSSSYVASIEDYSTTFDYSSGRINKHKFTITSAGWKNASGVSQTAPTSGYIRLGNKFIGKVDTYTLQDSNFSNSPTITLEALTRKLTMIFIMEVF